MDTYQIENFYKYVIDIKDVLSFTLFDGSNRIEGTIVDDMYRIKKNINFKTLEECIMSYYDLICIVSNYKYISVMYTKTKNIYYTDITKANINTDHWVNTRNNYPNKNNDYFTKDVIEDYPNNNDDYFTKDMIEDNPNDSYQIRNFIKHVININDVLSFKLFHGQDRIEGIPSKDMFCIKHFINYQFDAEGSVSYDDLKCLLSDYKYITVTYQYTKTIYYMDMTTGIIDTDTKITNYWKDKWNKIDDYHIEDDYPLANDNLEDDTYQIKNFIKHVVKIYDVISFTLFNGSDKMEGTIIDDMYSIKNFVNHVKNYEMNMTPSDFLLMVSDYKYISVTYKYTSNIIFMDMTKGMIEIEPDKINYWDKFDNLEDDPIISSDDTYQTRNFIKHVIEIDDVISFTLYHGDKRIECDIINDSFYNKNEKKFMLYSELISMVPDYKYISVMYTNTPDIYITDMTIEIINDEDDDKLTKDWKDEWDKINSDSNEETWS